MFKRNFNVVGSPTKCVIDGINPDCGKHSFSRTSSNSSSNKYVNGDGIWSSWLQSCDDPIVESIYSWICSKKMDCSFWSFLIQVLVLVLWIVSCRQVSFGFEIKDLRPSSANSLSCWRMISVSSYMRNKYQSWLTAKASRPWLGARKIHQQKICFKIKVFSKGKLTGLLWGKVGSCHQQQWHSAKRFIVAVDQPSSSVHFKKSLFWPIILTSSKMNKLTLNKLALMELATSALSSGIFPPNWVTGKEKAEWMVIPRMLNTAFPVNEKRRPLSVEILVPACRL